MNKITPQEENFSAWYHDVIDAAEMGENSPVRGCMIFKPHGYALWESIQKIFDQELKKKSVQNVYFPLLIPISFFEKEAEHIAGFAKECAVVTHSRITYNEKTKKAEPDSPLQEPYIVRPTSETIIGHTLSKWIQTYRDIPLKINQWCNIMRWELRPRMFLRTSEFLWQEGHTVYATHEEALADAQDIHNLYTQFIKEELAIPVICGAKTAEERFPGAVETLTCELMMQDGKALQGATSHHLGQTFSTAFDIQFTDKNNEKTFAYTTSWGMSTRLIGGIIMSHSDNEGLVLPPRIAPYAVSIIPIIHKGKNQEAILHYALTLKETLESEGIACRLDVSDTPAPQKIWTTIKKGIPIRLEIGNQELEKLDTFAVRRDLGKDKGIRITHGDLATTIKKWLIDMQIDLYNKRLDHYKKSIINLKTCMEMEQLFANDFAGLVTLPPEETETEIFHRLKEEYALSRRCKTTMLPHQDNTEPVVVVGRSY